MFCRKFQLFEFFLVDEGRVSFGPSEYKESAVQVGNIFIFSSNFLLFHQNFLQSLSSALPACRLGGKQTSP